MITLNQYTQPVTQAWKEAFRDKSFRWKILLTPGLFFVYSAVTQKLGNYFESRTGVLLEDRWLYFFPSVDFSEYVFILLYSSLLLLLISHLDKPKVILRIIEMHFAVAVLRQICILAVPLEPPIGMIVLRDVFLENTVYPHQSPMTKDLFFSGHVASVYLYLLCAERKWVKGFLLFSCIFMCIMILSMKVHYTYDVYGAFFFTTILYYAPSVIRRWVFTPTPVTEN